MQKKQSAPRHTTIVAETWLVSPTNLQRKSGLEVITKNATGLEGRGKLRPGKPRSVGRSVGRDSAEEQESRRNFGRVRRAGPQTETSQCARQLAVFPPRRGQSEDLPSVLKGRRRLDISQLIGTIAGERLGNKGKLVLLLTRENCTKSICCTNNIYVGRLQP